MGDTGNALCSRPSPSPLRSTTATRTGEGQAVSTSIVNAGLLHTSYAWIHADGRPGDWDHVDGDQYGLSPFYRMYQCADGLWVFLAAVVRGGASPLGARSPWTVSIAADRGHRASRRRSSRRDWPVGTAARVLRRCSTAPACRSRSSTRRSAARSSTTPRRKAPQLVTETLGGQRRAGSRIRACSSTFRRRRA